MHKWIFFGLLILGAVWLLPGCGVPQWIIDSGGDSYPLTPQAQPLLPTIAVTGTPIDAVEGGLSSSTREALALEDLTPQTAVATLGFQLQEANVESCTDVESGKSLNYRQALAIAADSECTGHGELLPARFCHEDSGTWWISLSVQKEGCNPACVVDVNSRVAKINWRCTGAVLPPEETPQPERQAVESDPLDSDFTAFDDWQGIIYRQPYGSLVEYRFLRDDSQWFDIGSPENDVRQQFASAAWSGAKVILSGEETAVPGSLSVEELVEQQASASEPRNLTAFAMPSSSSRLADDEGGSYYAWSAVDGILAQPWCEGSDGPGSGEWLQLDFTAPLEITEIKLANGYQSGDFLFVLNNRVQTASIFADDEWVAEWDLLDTREWQATTLAGEVSPGVATSSLRLVIEETIDGWEFDDTCIAELEVWGRPLQ